MVATKLFPKAQVLWKVFWGRAARKGMERGPSNDPNLFCAALVLKIEHAPKFHTIGFFTAHELGTTTLEASDHVRRHECPQGPGKPEDIHVSPGNVSMRRA